MVIDYKDFWVRHMNDDKLSDKLEEWSLNDSVFWSGKR